MSNVRKVSWCAMVVGAFVLSNFLAVASAAPKPLPTVIISNVNVDANSVPGTLATITWLTDPPGACDVLTYHLQGSNTVTTITPPCGTHQAALSGLGIHATYAFTITSSARKYNPGTYSSSFFPTDVSTSKAYEGYNYDFWATGFCGTKYVYTNRAASMPGDVEFNPANAPNGNAYETFDAVVHYYGQGQAWCWPYQLTTKRTTVQFYARDMTSGDNSWIAANTYPVPSVSGGNYVGSVQWTIDLGADAYGGSFGVSLSYNPASGIGLYEVAKNVDQPNGWKYLAYLEVDWNGGMQTAMDVAWPMHIMDTGASHHLHDQIQFQVVYTIVFDLFNPSWPWIGVGPWVGYDWTLQTTTTLGQGWDNDGQTNLDQYTDVQAGTSTGPG
ncbi:MAG TPA: hypothetical protein VEM95_00890 [Thermoplasmata archaeon]|nr:hypothetical protein [Thermoplasmata archaeon]